MDTHVSAVATPVRQVQQVANVHATSRFIATPAPQSGVDDDNPFEVIRDHRGLHLLFAVGTDRNLYCYREDPSAVSGWTRVDLLGSDGTYQADCFTVTTRPDGESLLLVGATRVADPDGRPVILSTSRFEPGLSEEDRFRRVAGPNQRRITHLAAGYDEQGNLLVAASTRTRDDADTAQNWAVTGDRWSPISVPADVDEVLEIQFGKAFHNGSQFGVFVLYRMPGGATEVVFVDLPEGRFNMEVAGSREAELFAFDEDEQGHHRLFLGGDHIFELASQHMVGRRNRRDFADNRRSVTSLPAVAGQIRQMAVGRNADGRRRLWVLDSHGNMFFSDEVPAVQGRMAWTDLVQIWASISHFRVCEMMGKSALFVTTEDHRILHFWHDPGSALWRQREVTLTDLGKSVDGRTYLTTVVMTDDRGLPIGRRSFSVSTTGWVHTIVNGRHQFLDQTPMELETDVMGRFVIQFPSDSHMACPELFIRGDSLGAAGSISIDPMLDVRGRIREVVADSRDFADFKRRVAPYAGGIDDGTLEGIYQLLQHAGNMEEGVHRERQRRSLDGGPAIHATQTNLVVAGQLQPMAHRIVGNEGVSFGLSFSGRGRMRYLAGDHEDVRRAISQRQKRGLGDQLNDAWNFVGDAIESLGRIIREGGFLVLRFVRDGVEMILGEKVHFFDSLEQLWRVLTDTIATVWGKFRELVTYMLDFSNVTNTATILKNAFNGFLDYAAVQIPGAFEQLNGKLDDAKDWLRNLLGPELARLEEVRRTNIHEKLDRAAGQASLMDGLPKPGQLLSLPENSFISDMLTRVMSVLANPKEQEIIARYTSQLEAAFEKFVGAEVRDVEAMVWELWSLIKDNPADLQPGTLLAVFTENAAEDMLGMAQELVTLLADLSRIVLGALKELANCPIDIPVVSAVFRLVGVDVQIPCMLDIVSYAVGIPMTLAAGVVLGTKEAHEWLAQAAKEELVAVLPNLGPALFNVPSRRRSVEGTVGSEQGSIEFNTVALNYLKVGTVAEVAVSILMPILQAGVDFSKQSGGNNTEGRFYWWRPSTVTGWFDFFKFVVETVRAVFSCPVDPEKGAKGSVGKTFEYIHFCASTVGWVAQLVLTVTKHLGIYSVWHKVNPDDVVADWKTSLGKFSVPVSVLDILCSAGGAVLSTMTFVDRMIKIGQTERIEKRDYVLMEAWASVAFNGTSAISNITHDVVDIIGAVSDGADVEAKPEEVVALAIADGLLVLGSGAAGFRCVGVFEGDVFRNRIGGSGRVTSNA